MFFVSFSSPTQKVQTLALPSASSTHVQPSFSLNFIFVIKFLSAFSVLSCIRKKYIQIHLETNRRMKKLIAKVEQFLASMRRYGEITSKTEKIKHCKLCNEKLTRKKKNEKMQRPPFIIFIHTSAWIVHVQLIIHTVNKIYS